MPGVEGRQGCLAPTDRPEGRTDLGYPEAGGITPWGERRAIRRGDGRRAVALKNAVRRNLTPDLTLKIAGLWAPAARDCRAGLLPARASLTRGHRGSGVKGGPWPAACGLPLTPEGWPRRRRVASTRPALGPSPSGKPAAVSYAYLGLSWRRQGEMQPLLCAPLDGAGASHGRAGLPPGSMIGPPPKGGPINDPG